jgi:hypothetical protein
MGYKIALCLRGAIAKTSGIFLTANSLYREGNYINFKACYNSIVKHMIEPNKDCSFDTFIHSWNTDLQQDLCDLYHPKKFLFENNSVYNEEISKKILKLTDFSGLSFALSIKKAIQLSEEYQQENNFKYDLVIIYRPDLILFKDINMTDYDVQKIYSNGNSGEDPQGDFHFIMNPEFANQFKGLYDSNEKGNPHKAHFWIKNYINNYMHQELIADNIIAGTHQEVLRKIYVIMVLSNKISMEKLLEYGLTESEILQYNFP